MHAGDDDVTASDAALLERARSNDLDALGELYARHREAGLRVASAMTSDPATADDLVSSAFERIRGALQRGHGPTDAFRPYLYTVIRRLAGEHAARAGHEQDVDDWAPLEGGLAFLPADTLDGRLVSSAFATLPDRHQAVLWYLDVEGMRPAEIAPMLGLSANAVSALAVRARDSLRDAYLQAHVSTRRVRPECAEIRRHLGAYVGGRISDRDRRRIDIHLESCDECPLVVAELREERGRLRAVLLPLVIGGGAAGLLGALGSVGTADSAQAAEAGHASVATMATQAVRRPGLWIAAAATVAILLVAGAIVNIALHPGGGPRGVVAQADTGAVAAIASGEPHSGADPSIAPTGVADGTSTPGGEGSAGAGGAADGTSGTGGTSGGTGTVATTAPTVAAVDPGAGGAPTASAPPAQPVAPAISASLAITNAGSILTGNKSLGSVSVTAKNVGPVSLGGTLTINLPSGVQYDSGLLSQLFGVVTNLVQNGAVCTPTTTQVVCQVISLIPGAAASVSIPVSVASGSEAATPTGSFTIG